MFISIDMDNLVVLHMHPDQETLSALSWLEAPNRSIMNENADRPHFLHKLSLDNLKRLYENVTGHKPPVPPLPPASDMHALEKAFLADLIARVVNIAKPTAAKLEEVQAQIDKVQDDLYNGIAWKYVKGSKTPTQEGDLYRAMGTVPTDAMIAGAATAAPQRAAATAAPVAPPSTESAPSAPQAGKARASSVRPQIWATADEMWAAAGSPTDRTVVLELRKKMMAELEEKHGVKKTSSSNELGNWMKARLG